MSPRARAARDTARTVRDAAATVRDAAHATGAIDPDTGEPYTPERIAALDVAAAEAQQAYTEAEGATGGRRAGADRGDQRRRRRDRRRPGAAADRRGAVGEGTADPDNGPLQEAVTAAETALATAQTELAELEASAGMRISPGEIVFAPVLPATLTEIYVALGSAVDGPVGMFDDQRDPGARPRRPRRRRLVAVGAEVEVEIRDAGDQR